MNFATVLATAPMRISAATVSPRRRPRPFEPPPVQAGVPTFSGTQLKQAHSAILHAREKFAAHLAATEQQRHHNSEDGFRAQVAKFGDTSAARGVEAALKSVEARRDAAAAKVEKIRRELSPDGDEAAELRALRYRDRVARQLDATEDNGVAFNLAQSLLAGATRGTGHFVAGAPEPPQLAWYPK
jgi:hypothetical protein